MTMTAEFGNLYIANKMAGIRHFNAPWFDDTAKFLLSVPGVTGVFNPVQHDREVLGFEPMGTSGSLEEAAAAGFDRRLALGNDWAWIAANSNGLIAGPDWATSTGAISEIACHQALGLPVWEWRAFREIREGLSTGHLHHPAWQVPSLKEFLG